MIIFSCYPEAQKCNYFLATFEYLCSIIHYCITGQHCSLILLLYNEIALNKMAKSKSIQIMDN